MKRIETELRLGTEPLTLLHISDTHLCRADERDNERKNALAVKRARVFPTAEEDYAESIRLARESGTILCHTGDLIDFVSEANLDAARQYAASTDLFFAAGNHEFSQYVGEAWEDADYRNQSLPRVQACFGNDIRFSARQVGGLNLVAIDDSYYRFEPEQLAALKAEAAKGLPILLFLHNPLHEDALYTLMRTRAECAYLTGTPAPLLADYSDHRRRQQEADAITDETIAYIRSEPCIKAIFSGHLHFDYEGVFGEHIPQFVTGIGTARQIKIL